jgi:hypothetical protein
MIRKSSRISILATTAGVLAGLFLAPGPAHGGLFRKGECPAAAVYVKDVTIKNQGDVNGEEVRADYENKLKMSLLKSDLALANDPADLGDEDVTLHVEVRAWTDRNSQSKRATLALSASLVVRDGQTRLWEGEISPGGFSKLIHMKHADPENLAKRTTDAFMKACRSGWELQD